jgi:hypothetical protein
MDHVLPLPIRSCQNHLVSLTSPPTADHKSLNNPSNAQTTSAFYSFQNDYNYAHDNLQSLTMLPAAIHPISTEYVLSLAPNTEY